MLATRLHEAMQGRPPVVVRWLPIDGASLSNLALHRTAGAQATLNSQRQSRPSTYFTLTLLDHARLASDMAPNMAASQHNLIRAT